MSTHFDDQLLDSCPNGKKIISVEHFIRLNESKRLVDHGETEAPESRPVLTSLTTDLCNSTNANAASPLGAFERPCSRSLTEDAASPIRSPISARVIPFPRKSDMRDAHGVLIESSLRDSVDEGQRHPVTEFRQNGDMAKPPGFEHIRDTPGDRVRFWREYRKVSRAELADAVGCGVSTISDLELNRTQKGTYLGPIAQFLRISLKYVESGKGEPERVDQVDASQPPDEETLPLSKSIRSRLAKLNPSKVERSHLEAALMAALEDIEDDRSKREEHVEAERRRGKTA
jgi:transcriptional regulator with XRE-family HTH domain